MKLQPVTRVCPVSTKQILDKNPVTNANSGPSLSIQKYRAKIVQQASTVRVRLLQPANRARLGSILLSQKQLALIALPVNTEMPTHYLQVPKRIAKCVPLAITLINQQYQLNVNHAKQDFSCQAAFLIVLIALSVVLQ